MKYFNAILVIFLILIAGCKYEIPSNDSKEPIDEKLSCIKDSDCVPAQCCHPTSVINKKFTPDCSGIFCTLECRQGTLDCGYGKPACINNKCTVIWNE